MLVAVAGVLVVFAWACSRPEPSPKEADRDGRATIRPRDEATLCPSAKACWKPLRESPCEQDAHCDDADPVTHERCVAGKCYRTRPFFVAGPGPRGDCMMEWLLEWGDTADTPEDVTKQCPKVGREGRLNTTQECMDGDPTCDLDRIANNRCEFSVGMCFCTKDPMIPGCSAWEKDGSNLGANSTVAKYCETGLAMTKPPMKPIGYGINLPKPPQSKPGKTTTYTCPQFYAQRLKESLIGIHGAVHVPSDVGYRVEWPNRCQPLTMTTPKPECFPALGEPIPDTRSCSTPQTVIVPLTRTCTRTTGQDGQPVYTARYQTGTLELMGVFANEGAIDRGGNDQLTLKCTRKPDAEKLFYNSDAECHSAAPCCGQPEPKPGGATDLNCCKMSPATAGPGACCSPKAGAQVPTTVTCQ